MDLSNVELIVSLTVTVMVTGWLLINVRNFVRGLWGKVRYNKSYLEASINELSNNVCDLETRISRIEKPSRKRRKF
jgi:hypothetical protein